MKKLLFIYLLLFSQFIHAQLEYKESKTTFSPWLTTTSDLNTVCIFIKFQGESEFSSQRSNYETMFNSLSSSSLKSYYKEVSYNKLNITTYLYPECQPSTNLSYVFPKPRGYFQPYSSSNTIGYSDVRQARLREHEILDSAVKYCVNQIPSSINFDFDNDGYVDNTVFIFKGSPGAWGDVGLWPHSGVLDTYDSRINNKRVYHYSLQLETYASASVFCHETFHVFGAPDLYRYFTSGTPVGSWDIMASGFAHMGAYMKYKYTNKNWIDTIPLITKSGTYTLSPLISDTNNCYRINSPYTNDEFFILEYRKQTGLYESSLPGSGLLVYRINNLAGDGNGGGPPDEIYIFRKGGTPTATGTISQAHFSSGVGRTAINDFNTDPKCFLSSGSAGGLDIRNIGTAGNTLSFDVVIVDCKITSPEHNSVFDKGQLVNINASAQDSALITKVEFFIDSVLVYTDLNYPYLYQWNTTNINYGKHILKIRATSVTGVYKENKIDVFISDGNPVVIVTNQPDTIKAGLNDTIIYNIEAKSAIGKIASVKYYVDGVLKQVQYNSPFSFKLSLNGLSFGKHNLNIVSTDSSGKTGNKILTIFIVKYLLKEDFESQWPPQGWTVNSLIYGWYQSLKGAYSGNKCAATRNYHASGEAILVTPSITIEPNTSLQFYWLDRSLDITQPLIAGYDTTYCEISVDGGNYSLLKLLSSASVDPSYRKEEIDLSQYVNKSIKIRWRDVSDESLEAQGTALDKVEIISNTMTNSEEYNFSLPSNFKVEQNFPNPFNPSTSIRYYVPKKELVVLKIYDVLGREIKTLVNEIKTSGQYEVRFNSAENGLSSGVYFYKLSAGNYLETRKMILLK